MDSTDELLLLNQICDDFEAARRSGSDIEIDDFLQQHQDAELIPPISCRVKSELIGLEVAMSDKSPESLAALKLQYPQYVSMIEAELMRPTRVDLADTTKADLNSTPLDTPKVNGYEIERLLGQGGMGSVFLAKEISTKRKVAIKLIHPSFLASATLTDQSRQRFEHEAMAASRLTHDNIVQVYEVSLNQETPWFTMQWIDGPSLSQEINHHPMDAKIAAKLLAQCADAIACAHEHGVTHRDIKPQNILISRTQNRAFVSDFGLAKLSKDNIFETVDGQLLGTPAYMSPEQADSSKDVGPASDIYSLGATLYHALTGRPPFQSANQLETMRQIREFKLVAPRVLNPEIPVDLESICLKALSYSQSNRYATAALMQQDLQNFLDNRPTIARPPSSLEKVLKWSARNPMLAKSIAAISTLLLALLLIATSSAIVFQRQGKQMAELADREREAKKEAIETLESAYKTFEPYFLSVDSYRGLYQDVPGTHALREDLLSQFIEIAEEFSKYNSSYEKTFNLMSAYSRLGFLRIEAGKYESAIDAFNKCEEKAIACRPEYESFSDEIKNSTRRLNSQSGEAVRGRAQAFAALNNDVEAEMQFRLAVEITDADSTIAIRNESYRDGGSLSNFTETSREFGRFLISRDRPVEASDVLCRALEKRDGFYNQFSDGRRNALNAGKVHVYKDLATTFALSADAYLKSEQLEQAKDHIAEMWSHLKVVSDEQRNSHNNIMGVEFLVCQCWNHAIAWNIQGIPLPDGTNADELLQESVRTLEKLAKRNPDVLTYKEELLVARKLEKKLRSTN